MCPVHQIYNFFLTPNRGLKLPTPVTLRCTKYQKIADSLFSLVVFEQNPTLLLSSKVKKHKDGRKKNYQEKHKME